MVVLHGAGSRKESHFDFARACRGRRAGGAVLRRARPRRQRRARWTGARSTTSPRWPTCCARGARRAGRAARLVDGRLPRARRARERAGAAAVVAICPASGDGAARAGSRAGASSFAADATRVVRRCWHDDRARRGRGALGVPLLLLHAEGDESVPVEHSRELHAAAPRQQARRRAGRPPPLGPARPRAAGRGVRWLRRALRAPASAGATRVRRIRATSAAAWCRAADCEASRAHRPRAPRWCAGGSRRPHAAADDGGRRRAPARTCIAGGDGRVGDAVGGAAADVHGGSVDRPVGDCGEAGRRSRHRSVA